METISIHLTVLFEEPFWVGLCERRQGGQYEACRIVFGAEPKDYDIYALILRDWYRLRFSPGLAAKAAQARRLSPKRMQREARRALTRGPSTKAQQALSAAREAGKAERTARARASREEDAARRLALRREKAREKHKGH